MTALIRRRVWPGLCLFLFLCGSAFAQTLPSASSAVSAMNLANSYFQAQFPNPGLPVTTSGTVRPSNYWFRAVYFEGLMDFYQINPQPSFISYAVTWGTGNAWGLVGGNTDRNANDQCAGQTYIDLYNLNPTPAYIANIEADLNYILASSAPVTDWYWIDAVHMAMPAWAKLGVLTGNTNYFNEMYKLYANTRDTQGTAGLYNPVDGLWWRDATFVNPPYVEPNGKSCYWSRGNGWVYSALVRVLDILPPSDPHYAQYLSDFQAMSAAILATQQSDGFWTQSLFDTTDFPGPETSGTALFTYGLAWGVRKGFLPAATYESAAVTAWNAMVSAAEHANGFLGYVQDTGDQPVTGVTYNSVPAFQDIGVGCFLLAGSEIVKLLDSLTATPTPTMSPTPSPMATATPARTATPLFTSTPTAIFTRTLTATPTGTNSFTPTHTPVNTSTNTAAPTMTDTATVTASPTGTNSATSSPTPSYSFTSTPTLFYTPTNTMTSSMTATPSFTPSGPPTDTPTSISSPAFTATASPTSTPAFTASWTPSASLTFTPTATPAWTNSITPTDTWTAVLTAAATASPTDIPSETPTPTGTMTETPLLTAGWTPTDTPIFTDTPSSTPTPTLSSILTPASTPTPPLPTFTDTATFTTTASTTSSTTPSPTNTLTLAPTATPSLTATPTGAFTATPSPTNFGGTPTSTPTPTPAISSPPAPVLYPNPATGAMVQINLGFVPVSSVVLKVYTTAFRLVLTKTYPLGMAGEVISLALSDNRGNPLSNGLYYVVVSSGSRQWILKLIVAR